MVTAVAASDSIARSASTFRISGCSASSLPKALRCRAWCTACASAPAHPGRRADQAVEPRVVDHPDDRRARRGPPRRRAGRARRGTPPRSTAASACRACPSGAGCGSPGRGPRSGSTTGPAGACASVRKRSHGRIRAEPLVAGDLPGRRRSARRGWCSRARPSRPASRSSPCRRARRRRSSARVMRGSHSAASSGSSRSAGIAE